MKIRKTIISTMIAALVTSSFAVNADTIKLKLSNDSINHLNEEGIRNYEVKKGDTLWDISERFFKDPMEWINLWRNNNHIKNPHLIYPKDVVKLRLEDGEYYIVIENKNKTNEETKEKITEIISPEGIETFVEHPIKTNLEFDYIKLHANEFIIKDVEELKNVLRVIGSNTDELKSMVNDEIIVIGNPTEELSNKGYLFKHEGKISTKLEKESIYIGEKLKKIGELNFYQENTLSGSGENKIYRAKIDKLSQEVDVSKNNTYFVFFEKDIYKKFEKPFIGDTKENGEVVHLFNNISSSSNYDSILINIGSDKLKDGQILSLNKSGSKIFDITTKTKFELPEKRYGEIIIVKAMEKYSIGVIINSKEIVNIGDIIK